MVQFLPKPLPERIAEMSLHNDVGMLQMLSVGVEVVTKDHNGLAIVPCKMITFAISKKNGDDERSFRVAMSMMPDLLRSIEEMVDQNDVA